MSIPTDNLLLNIKHDLNHRLLTDDWLSTVNIIMDDEHDIDSRIDQALKGTAKRNGKTGAYIVLTALQLTGANDGANTETPPMTGRIVFEVGEDVIVNSGSRGSGKNAGEITARLVDLLHGVSFLGTMNGLRLGRDGGVTGIPTIKGQRGFEIEFIANDIAFCAAPNVQTVTVSEDAGEITLATATAGASIYYTTDGSYPSSENSAATLYAAPFTLAADSVIRTAAEKTDFTATKIIREYRVIG